MKEKIKQVSLLGWIGIVLVTASFVTLIHALASSWSYFPSYVPWHNARVVSTLISINIFSEGTIGDTVYTSWRLSALGGILLFFILGPGMLILFGMKREKDPSTKSGAFWGFVAGLIITLTVIFMLGEQIVRSTTSMEKSKIQASKSIKIDEIRQNLATLATESYEYLVLPEEQGGGGGSFTDLKIEDLPSYGTFDSGTYTFGEAESDTLLRITATAKPDYPPATENSDGVTRTVIVQPSDPIRFESR